MPLRSVRHSSGLPAWRCGRGPVVTWGPEVGRTCRDAAAAAWQGAHRRAAVRLAHDLAINPDRSDAARAYRGRDPRFSGRLTDLYEQMLHQRARLAERVFFALAGPALRELQTVDHRADASQSAAATVYAVIRAVRQVFEATADADAEGLAYIAGEIDDDVTAATDAQLARLIRVPVLSGGVAQEQVDGWVRTNVALIRSLPETTFGEIERLVQGAMSGGVTTRDLIGDLQRRFEVGYSRASLIARDQTAKLGGDINRARQQSLGVTHFRWSTSGDARVRQSHAVLDGQIFSWAEGAPGVGLPGEDFQCRCDADPVLEDDDVAALRAAAVERQEREAFILSTAPPVLGQIPNRSGFGDWNAKRIAELRAGGDRARSAVGL